METKNNGCNCDWSCLLQLHCGRDSRPRSRALLSRNVFSELPFFEAAPILTTDTADLKAGWLHFTINKKHLLFIL